MNAFMIYINFHKSANNIGFVKTFIIFHFWLFPFWLTLLHTVSDLHNLEVELKSSFFLPFFLFFVYTLGKQLSLKWMGGHDGILRGLDTPEPKQSSCSKMQIYAVNNKKGYVTLLHN